MNRIYILAASVVLIGGTLLITSTTASAQDPGKVTLYGFVRGVKSDGAFPAQISFKDPVSGKTLAASKALVNIQNGEYTAEVSAPGLAKNATYKVSMEGLEAAEDFTLIDYVQLQSSTPGSQQTGHLNISGYVLASRIGLGISPTIAKVQVNETGTAQGVRSITNSGVAVYGQATASSGLAAGGYFTTSSVGGRAMVGDALSTTGSTVGGLFYNRSEDGVAVWGRHIKSTGNSIAILGQTASASGFGGLFQNTNTGSFVALSSSLGSFFSEGKLPRHLYTNLSASTMVPVAYGEVGQTGTVNDNGSANWTVNQVATGVYDIDVKNTTDVFTVVASSLQAGGDEIVTYNRNQATGDFRIYVYNVSSAGLKDSYFSFIAYKADAGSTARYQMPRWAESKYGGDIEAWEKDDPEGVEAYRQAHLAQVRKANHVDPIRVPYDEGEPAGQPPRDNVLPPRQ